MSDLRRGCIGAVVMLAIFLLIGGTHELPANYIQRCLQCLVMLALGFAVSVSLFGRRHD